MNSRQKEVLKTQLNDEQKILKWLKSVYEQAQKDTSQKISELSSRTDMENLQSIIYQKQYQEALKKQIDGVLDTLRSDSFLGISDYMNKCYETGYVGAMFDIHGQGIPLILPIDQKQVVQALMNDTKLSKGLYERLGEDTTWLKKSIKAELSRGIVNGSSWNEIANNIANGMNSPFKKAKNNAMRIARTEGGRVQSQAQMDAMKKAKSKGANIVKQWDATLDERTRDSHRDVDGEIRELDKPFSNGLMMPRDKDAPAGEVVNCRCAMLQRAKWGLDEDELQTLKERAAEHEMWVDESDKEEFRKLKEQSFEEFKEKYLNITEEDLNYYGGIPKNWNRIPSDDDAVINSNLNRKGSHDDGYSKNCPNSACAFEFRKRGYDVIARPYVKGGSHELNRKPWMAWKNVIVNDFTTPDKMIEYMKTFDDNSRFGIAIQYKYSGHVIVAEKKDDTIHFYDPQLGIIVENIDKDKICGLKLWRTDNLEPTDRGITSCERR